MKRIQMCMMKDFEKELETNYYSTQQILQSFVLIWLTVPAAKYERAGNPGQSSFKLIRISHTLSEYKVYCYSLEKQLIQVLNFKRTN